MADLRGLKKKIITAGTVMASLVTGPYKITKYAGEKIYNATDNAIKSISESELDKAKAENYGQLIAEYQDKLGFGDKVDFSSNAFNQVIDKRLKDHQGFSTPVGGSTVKEKLNSSTSLEATNIKKEIHEILNKTGTGLKAAEKNFQEQLIRFKDMVTKKIPAELTVEQTILSYYALARDARNSIEGICGEEKKALEEKFDNASFKETLTKEFQIDESSIESLKNGMIEELEASHKKNKDEFDKSIAESLVKIHNAANKEKESLNWIIYNQNHGSDEMKQLIEKELADRDKEKGGKTGASNDEQNDPYIIELKNLKTLVGKYGTEYKRLGDGHYQLSLGNLISDWKYNTPFYPRKVELMNLAKLVKAQGYDGINLFADFPIPPSTEEINKERAKEAYEAAIEAGFELKNISVSFVTKSGVEKLTFEGGKEGKTKVSSLYPGGGFELLQQRSKQVRDTLKLTVKTKDELEKASQDDTFKKKYEEIKTHLKLTERSTESKHDTPSTQITSGGSQHPNT